MLTPEQEALALRYDPFAGDKDDGGFRILRDQMVTARRAGPCATPCGEPVAPGQRVRKMVSVRDGEIFQIRFCEPCCRAMAADDEGEEIEQRFSRGMAARA